MLARQKKRSREIQPEQPKAAMQARPQEERYLLCVDGQMKRSFSDKEEALRSAAAIEKKFPVVVVTIIDMVSGSTEKIKK